MYIRWDNEAQEVIGVPRNAPGDDPGWVRCEMPPPRASRRQSLVWSLKTTVGDEPVLVGSWAGSSSPSYAELRASAYPPIEEQLDALWKGGAEMEAMRKRIMNVKEQYPKETTDETDTDTTRTL